MILKLIRKLEEGEAKAADMVMLVYTVADTAERKGIIWHYIGSLSTFVGGVLFVRVMKPISRMEVFIRHVRARKHPHIAKSGTTLREIHRHA